MHGGHFLESHKVRLVCLNLFGYSCGTLRNITRLNLSIRCPHRR